MCAHGTCSICNPYDYDLPQGGAYGFNHGFSLLGVPPLLPPVRLGVGRSEEATGQPRHKEVREG